RILDLTEKREENIYSTKISLIKNAFDRSSEYADKKAMQESLYEKELEKIINKKYDLEEERENALTSLKIENQNKLRQIETERLQAVLNLELAKKQTSINE